MPTEETDKMFSNKLILAPMVRVGTLPFRLLSLRHGAGLVYTEEIIDHKMIECTRVENELLNTVDFVLDNGTVVFRTCNEEKDRVILQLGTADPERAVKAAKLVEADVAGIDVNMGCPKPYSTLGGMGAAMLKTPDLAKEVLSALVKEVKLPITAKIRILPSKEDSVAFAKAMESTGIAALAIHPRFPHERPRERPHLEYVKAIAEELKIPVIASGGALDYLTYEEQKDFKRVTGATSAMLARTAQWNPSVFRPEGMLPPVDVMRDLLKVAIDVDNVWENTKFCLMGLFHNANDPTLANQVGSCKSYAEASQILDIMEYYETKEAELEARDAEMTASRKRSLEDGDAGSEATKRPRANSLLRGTRYNRLEWPNDATPKSVLYEWTLKMNLAAPQYEMQESKERCFRAMVSVAGADCESHVWEKSKKWAEQAAAAVALQTLHIPHTKIDILTKAKIFINQPREAEAEADAAPAAAATSS